MRKLLGMTGVVLILAIGAAGQFIGYTSAQSTTSTPFSATTCTAALAAGPVLVANIGQGAHFATATSAVLPTSLTYTIQASYDGSTFFDISDVGTGPVNASDITTLSGTGYYPVVAVKVSTCLPGTATFTIRYAGISLPPGTPVGAALNGQIDKHLTAGAAANSTFVVNQLRSPFGSSAGTLEFVYTSAGGPAGSTLQINCNSNILGNGPVIFGPVTLQTTLGLIQEFNVGAFSCPLFSVSYVSGGASTALFTLDYTFALPGSAPLAFQYTHVTGTTATVVKGTAPAFLHAISINGANASAATVSLFDLPLASCTGTPATNTVAVITTPASANGLPTYLYDVNFLNGICIKASAAMDITVSAE